MLGLEWGERRLANVHKLLRLARGFEASEGRDLRGFLDHASRLQQTTGARESDAPVEGVEPDAVRLMSIHAAKGLEFPVVCVADLGRAPNVRQPEVLVDGERLGLALRRLDGEKALPALDYEALAEERRRAESEEEDRILYVAMTRARERLLLSGAVEFAHWPEQRQGASMISWLGPALAAEVPALAACLQAPVHDLAVGGTRVRLRLSSPASAGDVLHRGSMSLGAPVVPSYLGGAGNIEGAIPGATQMRLFPVTAPRAAATGATGRTSTLSYTSLSSSSAAATATTSNGSWAWVRIAPPPPSLRWEGRSRHAPAGRSCTGSSRRSISALPVRPRKRMWQPTLASWVLRTSREEREEIALLIGGALACAPAARLATVMRVRREHPFAFALGADGALLAVEPGGCAGSGGPLITGVIDLLAEERDGTRMVLDYKSDRVRAEEDLDGLVEREYGLQRLVYALAVLRDGARRVEVVHWFLERPEDWVGVRYAESDRPELEERLAARIERARARGFAVSRTPSSWPLRDLSRAGGSVLLQRRLHAAREPLGLSGQIEFSRRGALSRFADLEVPLAAGF